MQLFNNSAIKIELFPSRKKKNKKQAKDDSDDQTSTVNCASTRPRKAKTADDLRGRAKNDSKSNDRKRQSKSTDRARGGSRNPRPSLDYHARPSLDYHGRPSLDYHGRPSLDYRRQANTRNEKSSSSKHSGSSESDTLAHQYSNSAALVGDETYHAISSSINGPNNDRQQHTTQEAGSLQQGQQSAPSQTAQTAINRPDSGPSGPAAARWVELPPNSPLIKPPPESPLISSRKAWGVEQLAPNSMSRLGTYSQKSPSTKTKISENMARALASKKSRERLRNEQAQAAMAKKQSNADLRSQASNTVDDKGYDSPSPPQSSGSTSSPLKEEPARPAQEHGSNQRTAKVPENVNTTMANSRVEKRRSVNKVDKSSRAIYADSEAQTSPDFKADSRRQSRQLDPNQIPNFSVHTTSGMQTVPDNMAPRYDRQTDMRSKRRSRSEEGLRAPPQPRSTSKPRSRSHSRPRPANINVDSAQREVRYRNQTGVSPMDWASKAAADRKRQWNYNHAAPPNDRSNYTNGTIPAVDAHVQQSKPGRRESWVRMNAENDDWENDNDYGSARVYGSHRISYGVPESPNPATIFGNALFNAQAGLGARTAGRA